MDELRYIEKQRALQIQYEERCLRCGACCGVADGDPCSNLVKDAQGAYFCRDYSARLGVQKTVSGKIFTCVPIRQVMQFDSVHPGCAYRKACGIQT